MTHEFDKGTQFDLVTTSYAHPAMPQPELGPCRSSRAVIITV